MCLITDERGMARLRLFMATVSSPPRVEAAVMCIHRTFVHGTLLNRGLLKGASEPAGKGGPASSIALLAIADRPEDPAHHRPNGVRRQKGTTRT